MAQLAGWRKKSPTAKETGGQPEQKGGTLLPGRYTTPKEKGKKKGREKEKNFPNH